MALPGVARRWVRKAEMPCGSAEAGRVTGTMEGALSRSSIFSYRGDGSSCEETVGRFWSLGETDLTGSREAREAAAGGRSRIRRAGAGRRQEASEVGTRIVKAHPAPT